MSLTTRSSIVREANRLGLLTGLLARGRPLSRHETLMDAADSVTGRSPLGHCAIHTHWHAIFKRVFIKAALRANTTDRTITVRS